jgi:hypothetical protein
MLFSSPLVWVLWRVNTCPMRLIGLAIPFWPSGGQKVHSHGFGRLYYGAGVSYGEMGSLVGTDTELDIHPPQKNSVPDHPVKYADRPTLYSDCLMPYADGPNGLSRFCTACGGLGAGLGNLLLKMGSTAAGLDGPRSRANGPDMRRSTNLLPMCVRGYRCPRYMSIGIP